MTAMFPKSRLGKRSPLGALVCSSCPTTEGHQGDPEGGVGGVPTMGPGFQPLGRVKLHPGQKVYVLCGGRECVGVVEQHNHVDNQVSVLLPTLGQHVQRKVEDVWTTPSAPPPSPTAPQTAVRPHPVSSCIDVPRSYRSPESVDMDEMMAAMVLSSLSCSPLVQSPPQRDTVAVAPSAGMECGGGELSDSGSSGYWSWDRGNGSPTPSPPIAEAEGDLATPPDEGLDMELEQVLFDEPAPRKRRNSVKVAYRCLWPSCGKILTSLVGIKRHIRILHLGHSGEHERCSRSEEDFYYTEVHQRDQQALTPPPGPPGTTTAPWPACASPTTSTPTPASPPGQPGGADPGAGGGRDSPADGPSQSSPLSQSAPTASGTFLQVHCEHSYQAPGPTPPPPIQVEAPRPVSVSASCRWPTPTPATHCRQSASFRVRSVSVGEQWLQQHSAPLRTHPGGSSSPPRSHWATRRVRGEAKKCRKVYGIEHRDQWCTACRWKKACQRFLD